jgi:hypothetical protein
MKPNSPELPEWTKNKRGLSLALALLNVFTSEALSEILKDPNAYYRKWGLTDVPPTDVWLSHYTSDDIIILWLFDLFEVGHKDHVINSMAIGLLAFLKGHLQTLRERPDKMEPVITKEQLLNFADWLENADLKNVDLVSFVKKINKISKDKTEFDKGSRTLFVFRVLLPCFYYFRETPHNLFKKAINGDFEALCNLLRIDKAILKDEKIFKLYQQVNFNPESTKYNGLIRAIGSPIKIDSEKQVKGIIAAIISEFSKSLGPKLTAPEILDLFDFVEEVKDKDSTQDEDIKTLDSLKKQIQRKTPKYKKLFEV